MSNRVDHCRYQRRGTLTASSVQRVSTLSYNGECRTNICPVANEQERALLWLSYELLNSFTYQYQAKQHPTR